MTVRTFSRQSIRTFAIKESRLLDSIGMAQTFKLVAYFCAWIRQPYVRRQLRTYDLLLLDIRMPHMNGFELYQKIRLADKHAKVCFITAFEEFHTEFKELFPDLKEADCFIRKPIELESLTKKIKSLVHGE